MHQLFQLAIWSTGSDDYVSEIVKAITPANCHFEFVWGRSRCTARNVELKFGGRVNLSGIDYVKPLKKVKKLGYPLERILMVDDSPYKCADNYGNAIYIKAFEGDANDNELPKLDSYLKQLQPEPDYRKIEKRGWENR
jgi:RNA polymerase II subunit A small phosphatase-like protein